MKGEQRSSGGRSRPPDWARELDAVLHAALVPLADADRAGPMAAYMRGQFPFLGIAAPPRASATKTVLRATPAPPDAAAVLAAARLLYGRPEREHHYAAIAVLERYRSLLGPDLVADDLRWFVATHSWWDTVDTLAGHVIGPIVLAHRPELVPLMRTWVTDDDVWVARVAILHQLGAKAATDEDVLFELCAARATDHRFFAQKAIGWALRTHARRRPAAVLAFLAAHPELSPLAVRESAKHLGGPGTET